MNKISRLPFKSLFIQPQSAFVELAADPPVSAVFVLFLLVSLIECMLIPIMTPDYDKILATISRVLPFLGNPRVAQFLEIPLNLLVITFWGFLTHVAAKILGGKGSFKSFWTVVLFITAVVWPFKTLSSAIPYLTLAFLAWEIVLVVIAVTAVYEFKIGRAIATAVMGSGAAFAIGVATIATVVTKTGLLEKTLQSPAAAAVNIPADYEWAAQSLDGGKFHLSDAKGKVVFLNIWATWCMPCTLEMPGIQSLYEKLKAEEIVFICVSDEEPEKVREFIAKKGYTFPVYTTEEPPPDVYKTNGIPATFILSRKGAIVLKHQGAARWDSDEIVRLIQTLIGSGIRP